MNSGFSRAGAPPTAFSRLAASVMCSISSMNTDVIALTAGWLVPGLME